MWKLIFIITFFPILAIATPFGDASGLNKSGEIIKIGDEAEFLYVFKNNKDERNFKWSEKYIFKEVCPTFFTEHFAQKNKFSCKLIGKSPLAGTTYKLGISKKYQPCNTPPYNDKSGGQIFVCIKGCNIRAPKLFYVSPYEC